MMWSFLDVASIKALFIILKDQKPIHLFLNVSLLKEDAFRSSCLYAGIFC